MNGVENRRSQGHIYGPGRSAVMQSGVPYALNVCLSYDHVELAAFKLLLYYTTVSKLLLSEVTQTEQLA